MSFSFSAIWNTFLFNTEEDPSEAYVLVPQDEPILSENEQPVDLNTPDSPIEEYSDTKTSTEKEEIENIDSGAETAAPNLPDESQIQAENQQPELVFVAVDDSTVLTGHSTDNSPVAEASDIESSNTEKGTIGDLDCVTETAASNLPDDSHTEAENEQLKECTTDDSSDSTGETIVNENNQISSSAEEKMSKKLFLYDTTATIIGLVVPILAIGFGAGNIGNCPANFHIPYLVLTIGVLTLSIVSYCLLKSTRENFDCWTECDEDAIFMASYILTGLWIWKCTLFYSMHASFDSSAEDYCSYMFYIFCMLQDIFIAMAFIIGSCLFNLYSKTANPQIGDDQDWLILG